MWITLSATAAIQMHVRFRKSVFWDTVGEALLWTAACTCVVGVFALPILGVWLVRKLKRIPAGMTVVFILSCVTSVLGVVLLVYGLRIAFAFGAMPP